MRNKKLDFGWGDTRGFRSIATKTFGIGFSQMPIDKFGYPPNDGDQDLILKIKNLTSRLTGKNFEFILITNGCTQAISASVHALKSKIVFTRDLYYPRYASIISDVHDLSHMKEREAKNSITSGTALVDSPSNPLGKVDNYASGLKHHIVWDGAYHTPTYGKVLEGVSLVDSPDVFCGSLSKLSGINGIRIGWAATNSPFLHEKMSKYVKSTTCGASFPSQWLANKILEDDDKLNNYFVESRSLLEANKEEVEKLAKIFGTKLSPEIGMFAFSQVDEKLKQLIKECDVVFTDGKECGADFESVRINLANPFTDTKEMVERIVKRDSV